MRHRPDPVVVEMLDGCEALLAGRYVEYLETTGQLVPAWAWTNLLAHGTVEQFEREISAARDLAPESGGWRRARAYLAGELLAAAGRLGSLQELQAEVLVPLELELAADLVPNWLGPGRWAMRVLEALAEHGNAVPRR
jgi:hypothetical protein